MNAFKTTVYSPVLQNESVYSPTTETRKSLSPTREVFENILQGRINNKPKFPKTPETSRSVEHGRRGTGWQSHHCFRRAADDNIKSLKKSRPQLHRRSRLERIGVFTTMVCGLCAITLGSILVAVDPYEMIFTSKVTFAPGKEEFKMWEKPEVNLYLKVYLFNVTNSEEYMSGKDKKLRFQQTGPYVYREDFFHGNATFNENGTITSVPNHPLVYMPELSAGDHNELLILPNIALLSFAHVMRDASLFTRMGINVLIKNTNTQPLVQMSAKEFMFGYKSTLLTLGNKFLPSWIGFDKLGLIDRMYNFEGDISTTYTGETDIRLGGLIEKYNRLPHLPHWPYPCNNLTGASDGTKFNARIAKDQELLFFRKSICRAMPLVKVGEETVGGIHGYKYEFKPHALDNGKYLPENKCFCKESCLPAGIIDVRDCYYGFPIALSYPHFLETDESVLNAVEGLEPTKEKHSTSFVINEEAGLPLNVSVKMQINMALGDLSRIANSNKFSNIILPMLWMEIEMPGLTQSMATKFWLYLTVGPIAQTLGTYLLLVCGVAFILLSLASAVLIPRMSLISSNRGAGSTPGTEPWRQIQEPRLPIGKKRNPPTSQDNNNKEMDMYYCSLLAVPSEEC